MTGYRAQGEILPAGPVTGYRSPLTDQMASNAATQYRTLLWLFTGMGLFCFWPAFQGIRGLVPPLLGMLSGGVGVLCLFTGAWFGVRGAKIRIAERQKKADAVALRTIAAILKDRNETELQAMVAEGGPAAEAARLVLERRKQGLRPSGTHDMSSRAERGI